ncbi:MAG: DUF3108 domain-containing protein [Alphaproteobacteria bacterium]|nr:MAG: DUF3108 domain-containing protein [Alphaproteobacteria bacterium]
MSSTGACRFRGVCHVSGMLSFRTLAIALMVSAGLPSLARAAVIAHYDVYVGGVRALQMQAALGMDEGSYSLQLTARTHGFAEWLLGWRSRVISTGLLERPASARGAEDRAGVRPSRHSLEALFRGSLRTVRLDWTGTTVSVSATPPIEEDNRDPVPDALRVNAVDPLTATVIALRAVAERQACQQDIPVFDGRRRFDAVLQTGTRPTLPANSYSSFEGAAVHCTLRINRIAGYSRSENNFNRAEDRDRSIDIWFAPVATGAVPVPVRVEVELSMGAIVAHLMRVETVDTVPPLPTGPLTR